MLASICALSPRDTTLIVFLPFIVNKGEISEKRNLLIKAGQNTDKRKQFIKGENIDNRKLLIKGQNTDKRKQLIKGELNDKRKQLIKGENTNKRKLLIKVCTTIRENY